MKKNIALLSSVSLCLVIVVSICLFNAQATESVSCNLPVQFDSSDDNIQLAKDVIVATDKDFTKVIKDMRVNVDLGKKAVSCDFSNNIAVNTVYIKIPDYYTMKTFNSADVSLGGNSEKLFYYEGTPWFSISNVREIEPKDGSGTKKIVIDVKMEGNKTFFPRTPKLMVGNKSYDGAAMLYFDDDSNFKNGTYIFEVPTELNEDLSQMYLTIESVSEHHIGSVFTYSIEK